MRKCDDMQHTSENHLSPRASYIPEGAAHFQLLNGNLISLVINRQEQLTKPVYLDAFRASIDNERRIVHLWTGVTTWQGENSEHTFNNVRSVRVENHKILIDGALAGISCRPYFRYGLQLYQAKHIEDLPLPDASYLRIDYKNSGVGSNSCSPQLHPDSRFRKKKYTLLPRNTHCISPHPLSQKEEGVSVMYPAVPKTVSNAKPVKQNCLSDL